MEPEFGSILEVFAAETEENLRTIDEGLVVLEQKPDDAETIATIFRMVHTVKGNAASLGYPSVAEFAHGFEEVLDRLRRRILFVDPTLTTLLLAAVDALRQLVTGALAGEPEMSSAQREVLRRLGATAEAANADAPPMSLSPASILAASRPPGAAAVPTRPPAAETPESPHSVPPPAATSPKQRATLRIDVERLDRMLDLVGEVAIDRARMHGLLASLGDGAKAGSDVGESSLLERFAEADVLYAQIQELVLRLRMVSVGPLFRQQARVVRDVAAGLGKQARLVLEGEDEEMDTAIVDHLKDPLTHMIRNAIDHGIESPEARARLGKDPTGTITLRARHEGGAIVIQLADDGGGLKRDAIAARAREMGALEPEALGDSELFAFIFEPGFSTAAAVTDVSGRGVGMDVVLRGVKSLRGVISIASQPGKGTTFTIRLPLTVAIIDGFAVTVANETYVVPLENVSACMELPAQALASKGRVLDVRGDAIPYFRLRDVFKLKGAAAARESVVLLEEERTRVGLAVDELLGVTQVVIKSPGKLLEGRPGVAGSTILGTGRVAFILDVPGLLRMAAPAAAVEGS